MRTMLVIAKRVTSTLHPSRPRKTGSRYNDILCWVGKPKGSVTMSQKQLSHSFPYYAIFDKNCSGGHFTPPAPVAGIRVNDLSCHLGTYSPPILRSLGTTLPVSFRVNFPHFPPFSSSPKCTTGRHTAGRHVVKTVRLRTHHDLESDD